MKQRVEEYKSASISLKKLVDDLEGLFNCLENSNEDWRDSFYSSWGVLEDIYSFSVYDGQKKLESEDQEIILRNLEKISKLIDLEGVELSE